MAGERAQVDEDVCRLRYPLGRRHASHQTWLRV